MDSRDLQRAFELFDHNGDGRITRRELWESLQNLGIDVPEADLTPMIANIDADGDGCVDIDEFEVLYQTIMEDRADQEEEEEMREAFKVFDKNGDGFISDEELRSVLAVLGLGKGRTVEDCRRMIGMVDVDGDGMVNFDEFLQMMKGGEFAALD